MSLSLKVRAPGFPAPVSMVISASALWGSFLKMLREELNLKGEFEVLCGFPVAVADFTDEQIVGEVIKSNEVIRVQYKSVSGQQAEGAGKFKVSRKSAKAASSDGTPVVAFGAKVAKIKHAPNRTSYLTSSPGKRSSGLEQPGALKKRRKVSSANKISSEGDIAEHLISAVSGGTGVQNRAARKVFRNAVLHQYNSTQAVSRVNATFSGNFSIRECGGVVLSNSSSSKPSYSHIEVTYHKGAGSRGNHVDVVELLSKELLLGVLKVAVQQDPADGDDDREALKPMNLARCSPRIFWSIVYHYGANMSDGIRTALQGVDDCAWLDDRKRELSEKAKENLQQKAELDSRKRKRKGAAEDVNIISSPVIECPPPKNVTDLTQEATTSSTVADPLQKWLIHHIEEQLAIEDFVPAGWVPAVCSHVTAPVRNNEAGVLQLAACKVSSKTRDTLLRLRAETDAAADSSGDNGEDTRAASLSLDQLDAWVGGARMACFHAVWRLLCGGGSERLRRALYRFRLRRPRDFKVWQSAPEGLLQGLLDQDAGLSGSVQFDWPADSPSGCSTTGLNAERVAWMYQVALAASAALPWMDDEDLCEAVHGMEGDADGDVDDEGEQDEAMSWLYQASASEFVGRRVRVEVDNGYWEDGTVVAYLPPEPEEPMALWRVKLDARPSSKRDRFEDLEEHELVEAIGRTGKPVA
jgi:hypothetical protein